MRARFDFDRRIMCRLSPRVHAVLEQVTNIRHALGDEG